MRRSCLSMLLAAHAQVLLAQGGTPEPGGAPTTLAGPPVAQQMAVPANPEILFLGVSINGVTRDDDVEALQLAEGDLAIAREVLSAWNMPVARELEFEFEGVPYVRLNDLPALQWRIDARTQTLAILARPEAFNLNRLDLADGGAPTVTPSPAGAYVNYDVLGERNDLFEQLSGLYQLNVFGALGRGATSSLYRSNAAGGAEKHIRLETNWSFDMPGRRQTVWMGDAITRGGSLGRSVRFGGIRWGTNFALTPGFSTFALPTVRGEAALPSTLDLFINNNYGAQTSVPAGPFDLADLPLVTGQGEIRMTVRDLLGREQVITQQYYASPMLLRPGLRDFSLEAGKVREDYGFRSNRYGRSFVAGNERKGMSPTFTRELRGEWLAEQQMLGLGGTWLLGTAGTLTLQGAGSRSEEGAGWSSGVSFDRQARGFSGNVTMQYATRDFAQLGDFEGRQARLTSAVSVGVPFMRGGLGASYARQTTWQNEDARIATLSYSRSVGRKAFISVSALRQMGDSRDTAIAVTFVHTLGQRDSISAVHSRNRGPDVEASYSALQLQRNVPAGPGFGYQINAEQGEGRRYSALGTWNTDYTRLTAGAAGGRDVATAYRIGAAGSVALLDGGVYPTRQIDDSFAVVKVDDYRGISVMHENQKVATTGRGGYAFVPLLRGYQPNEISIDQSDLPFDAEIDRLSINVTPALRSGVLVTFPVRRTHAGSGFIHYADGSPLPPGTRLDVRGQDAPLIVGFEGRVFISSPVRSVQLSAAGERPCSVGLELDEMPESMSEFGVLICQEN